MKKIVLDAGHGFNTPGKRTPNDVREWSLNNKVCNYIAKHLQGYNVEIIRTDDVTGAVDVSLANRRKKTNTIKPNLFISIHHNALNGQWNDATGIEVYTHTLGSAEDKKVANIIAPKLSSYTGLKNRGVKKAFYYVLGCKSSIPAVLVEGGFMDSRNDNKVITSSAGQENYGKAVAEAIIEYLGLSKGQEVQTPSKPQQEANKPAFEAYKVKITTDILRVRNIPSTSGAITTRIKKGEIYTIIEERNGWGKLKSGAGWICLDYTTRDINSSINPIKNNKFNVKVNKKRAMVRSQPNSKSPLAGSRELHYGDVFVAIGIVKGENVNGNNLWYKSVKGNYVWSGGLIKI